MRMGIINRRVWLALILASAALPDAAQATHSSNFDQSQSAIGVCMVPSSSASRPAVRIESIFPTGPASKAGMEEGDLILQVDGHVVDSNLPRYIATRSPGTSLNAVVQRGRATQDLTVITEERSSLLKRIALEKSAPPSAAIGSLSVDTAQKAIVAALSKTTRTVENVRITSNELAYTRVWGEKADQRYSVAVQFACHAYFAAPRHEVGDGWIVDNLPPGYYEAWNDKNDATDFVLAINRLIWEHSPQMIGQKLLQRDLFEQQVAAWRAAGAKVDPPEEAQRHSVIAQAAYQDKNLDHAASELAAALDIYPTWPANQYDLALILGELNRYSEALDHMQMYLDLAPDAPNAQQCKQQIWIWQDKVRGGN